VIEAVGPGCPPDLGAGGRVSVWPVLACGTCHACRAGRDNACANVRLIGINVDGALQDRLCVPASQVVPVGLLAPAAASLVEPVSIGVRAVTRCGVASAGRRIAVLGAGPIGQVIAFLAGRLGASVLLVDRLESRLAVGRLLGSEVLLAADGDDLVRLIHGWSGPVGPDAVIDATGVAGVIRAAVEAVAPTGRVVIAGISNLDVSLPIGLFTAKEIDVLGTSCCNRAEFQEAARVVASAPELAELLITHEFPLERTPEAFGYVAEHPEAVMKAIVRLD
jgi:L-gulonate 5-dehydrogenase